MAVFARRSRSTRLLPRERELSRMRGVLGGGEERSRARSQGAARARVALDLAARLSYPASLQ